MSRAPSLVALALAASLATPTLHAHPFGLSSTNRLFAIEPDERGARVAYVLDFAELPTTDELTRLDRDRDGQVTPQEREAYLGALFESLANQWQWSVDDAPTRLRLVARNLEVTPGEANLHTLRVIAELRLDRPANARGPFTVRVRDESYADRPGWRELRAEGSARITAETIAGAADPTILARRANGERVTLRMNDATFRFRPASAPPPVAPVKRAFPVQWLLVAAAVVMVIVAFARRLRPR
ncbi:MAG: hypothetical protein U0269_29085 [Polyangiales bacterium]